MIVRDSEPVVVVEMTREQYLAELERREAIQHQIRVADLQADYRHKLEGETERHTLYLDRIQRALAGEYVPGICRTCGRDYNIFHRVAEEGKCPKCGAELGEAEG